MCVLLLQLFFCLVCMTTSTLMLVNTPNVDYNSARGSYYLRYLHIHAQHDHFTPAAHVRGVNIKRGWSHHTSKGMGKKGQRVMMWRYQSLSVEKILPTCIEKKFLKQEFNNNNNYFNSTITTQIYMKV